MSREHIIVAQQPETQVYAGDTGYIVIKQTNWPEEPVVVVLDSIHAEAVAKAILACAADAAEFRMEWMTEGGDDDAS